jgi:hypothetical protein
MQRNSERRRKRSEGKGNEQKVTFVCVGLFDHECDQQSPELRTQRVRRGDERNRESREGDQ